MQVLALLSEIASIVDIRQLEALALRKTLGIGVHKELALSCLFCAFINIFFLRIC